MATVSLPYTLTAGDPENVNQLRDNLNALVTGVNAIDTSQISANAITSAKLASDIIPVGMIVPYAGSVTSIPTAWGTADPYKWLVCDGAEKAVSSYPDLDSILGTLYGTRTNGSGGAGSTHFRLPNLKGRVLVARDASQTEFDVLGETGGAKTVTLTAAQSGLPSHAHTYYSDSVDASVAIDNSQPYTGTLNPTAVAQTTSYTGGTNASQAHENLPPYLVVNYIIRAV